MKNISFFLSENVQFLEVKFSIYLNRRVFVMGKEYIYKGGTCIKIVLDAYGKVSTLKGKTLSSWDKSLLFHFRVDFFYVGVQCTGNKQGITKVFSLGINGGKST